MILRKQFLAHVAQTSPSPMLVEVARAEGSFFYTPEGKRYFDLVAGVSVSNVGHGNPAVVRAVQEQAARYMHVMVYGELVETPQVEYAARIASLLPAPLESVYFVNSGAEAVEGALKLAKRFTRRTEIVSMRRAYHGSTHGAMSMMGAPEGEEWKGAFRPLLPDVQAVEFNDFSELERITRRTACVLAEPVQGEAGVRPPRPGYLDALRRRCDEVGALLIFDEIQTGMGRTGRLFAMQKYGVTPDVVIGCMGGGSNYGGLIAPYMAEKLQGKNNIRFIGVEPASCPSMSRGKYAYDFCDSAKITPLAKMYTLGCEFMPSRDHAGGLRYHGMSPVVSKLYHDGYMEVKAVKQTDVFRAAEQFARCEGILPAPESSHAIKVAVDEALECK